MVACGRDAIAQVPAARWDVHMQPDLPEPIASRVDDTLSRTETAAVRRLSADFVGADDSSSHRRATTIRACQKEADGGRLADRLH